MPSTQEHLAIAGRNRTTLEYLLKDPAPHAEWIATVAFYTALHHVEAVFFNDTQSHGHNHENRERCGRCRAEEVR